MQLTPREPPAIPPAFTLKDLTGRTRQLNDFNGKVVLINFWATWCVPCLAEMPELVKWQKEYKDHDLQIIGITHPPQRRSQVNAIANKAQTQLSSSVRYARNRRMIRG